MDVMENPGASLLSMPDEVLYHIAEYLNAESLGRLACTCKKMCRVIDSETVWREKSLQVLGSNLKTSAMQKRSKPVVLSMKQRCAIGRRWKTGDGKKAIITRYGRCMPWIYLEQNHFYSAKGRVLMRFERDDEGKVVQNQFSRVFPHSRDVSKFVIMDDEVISAGRDGTITRLNKLDFENICSVHSQKKELTSIDAKNGTIVTGSIDCALQVWKAGLKEIIQVEDIDIGVRILSVSIMPSNKHFIVGLPGTKDIHPLQLFDIERGKQIACFGESFRKGAGILDIYPEDNHTFLCCGYDTTVQLWDTRMRGNCVSRWMEPFDNSIYSVKSDHNITITTGANRNGIVHLWDKRTSRCQFIHYATEFDSPAYCVSFDAANLFAAFDRGAIQISFL